MLLGPIYSSQVCEFTRYSSSAIKTGSAKHSSNKSKVRSAHCLQWAAQLHQEAEGMPRATKSWLRTAGTPGVSACDNEAWRGHASVNPSSQTAARLWFSPPTPLGWLQTGPGAFASQLSHALLGHWGSAWPSSPHMVPWLSTAPAGRAPWCRHPPRCSPRPLTG